MLKQMERMLLGVLLASAAVMIAPVVAAQTPTPTVETPLIIEPERIEGLEQAINRDYRWTVPASTPKARATPALNASAADESNAALNLWVGDLDSPEHAGALFTATDLDQFVRFVLSDPGDSGEFEEVEVEEARYAVKATAGTVEVGGVTSDSTPTVAYVFMQKGDRVVVGTAFAPERSPRQLVNAVLPVTTAVLTAPAGEGDPVFDEDGRSRGGLWEVLPAPGEVAGLEALEDEQLWPEREGQ